MKVVFLAFLAFFFSTISFAERFSILVRTIEGKTLIVKVSPETLVSDLRERLFQKNGIPKDITRLSHLGRPLIDDKNLSSQNIGEGSTIMVLMSLLSDAHNVNK